MRDRRGECCRSGACVRTAGGKHLKQPVWGRNSWSVLSGFAPGIQSPVGVSRRRNDHVTAFASNVQPLRYLRRAVADRLVRRIVEVQVNSPSGLHGERVRPVVAVPLTEEANRCRAVFAINVQNEDARREAAD